MNDSFYERNQTALDAKARNRRAAAQLPFEEKLRILVQLQEAAYEIKQDERYKPWPLPSTLCPMKIHHKFLRAK